MINYEWRGVFENTEVNALHAEWLHVDFEDHLQPFYFDAARFTPTSAGLIAL